MMAEINSKEKGKIDFDDFVKMMRPDVETLSLS